jgi:hypothetical protein
MDNAQISYIGPLAPIIGAIIGGAIGIAGTYYFVAKRKRLAFWVTKSEDLTSALRRHHREIIVSVGGQGFLSLNRSTIVVKNIGNVSIGDFKFDIEIPGEHQSYLTDVLAQDAELGKAITVTMDQPPRTLNPTFHVNVNTFLNSKETLKIAIFFDGEAEDCRVRCRIADVYSKVKVGEPFKWSEFNRVEVLPLLLMGIASAGILASFLSAFFDKVLSLIWPFSFLFTKGP